MRFSEEVQAKLTILKVKEWETFQVVLRLLGRMGLNKKKSGSGGGLKSVLRAGLIATVLVVLPSTGIAAGKVEQGIAVMDEVVVTATKSEEKRKDIVNSVVMKDALDIEEAPAESLGSLLANEPGIDWRTRGNYGGAAEEIQIRGMDANGTQVVVDGVVANSASLGSADVGLISLSNIEKVEVVKGPGSLLYGSGAAAGTVNIITKKPKHDDPVTRVEAGYGTEETYHLAAETGRFVTDSFGYYFTANRRESDGYRDNSDMERNDLSLKFLLDKGAPLQAVFYFDYLDREFGVPGVKPPEGTPVRDIGGTIFYNSDAAELLDRSEDENRRSALELKGDAAKWLKWRLLGSCSVQESYNYDRRSSGIGSESTVVNTVRGIEGNVDLKPVSMLGILLGTEYRDFNYENEQQTLDVNGAPDVGGFSEVEHGVETQGTFVEASVRPIEQVKLVAGYRYEKHSEFGHEDVHRVGLVVNPVPDTAIKVNYGEHFKAPTMNDLFWPDDGWNKGNENLKPETGVHTDVTVEQSLLNGKIFATVSWFKWDINDKIAWAPDTAPGSFYWLPSNVAAYKAKGWEGGLKIGPFHSVETDLGLTLVDAEEETAPGETRRSNYTPKTQFKAGVTYYADFGLTANLVARYTGSRTHYYTDYNTFAAAEIDLKSYWTVDLKLTQDLAEHWKLAVLAGNLFAEEYDTYTAQFRDYARPIGSQYSEEGYPGAGRSVFASIAYEF